MARTIDPNELDAFITGNYGEDDETLNEYCPWCGRIIKTSRHETPRIFYCPDIEGCGWMKEEK